MLQPKLQFVNRSQAVKETGLSYIGGVSLSQKMVKSEKKNILTYIIYLSPANKSGYNVCPKASADCIAACLNTSGRVKLDTKNIIENARIKKTKMFFENRDFFMGWLYAEISAHKKQAELKGMGFAVRLNGTSDIEPTLFKYEGKTLFEHFPNVNFYDYTKVANRFKLTEKYPNYDLTFSYSGENWLECEVALANNVRIAVVFEKGLPKTYKGIPVINADLTDLRYLDEKNVICGLTFKKIKGNPNLSESKFIIKSNDKDCVF